MRDPGAALARARAAALDELRRAPAPISWRRSAVVVAAGSVGTSLLVVLATWLASVTSADQLLARTPWLAALVVFAAAAAAAALAPRAAGVRAVMLFAGAALMVALVLSRGAGLPSAVPGWVCSSSHLGLDLLPLGAALIGLRQAAWRWSRAVVAGLGAGATGALLGELACHQGARHVLVHHVGAWLLAAAACVVISRRLRPRTFAP